MNFLHVGRAGTGKTTALIEKVVAELVERPLGSPIYFLVPDQMAFEMERSAGPNDRVQSQQDRA